MQAPWSLLVGTSNPMMEHQIGCIIEPFFDDPMGIFFHCTMIRHTDIFLIYMR